MRDFPRHYRGGVYVFVVPVGHTRTKQLDHDQRPAIQGRQDLLEYLNMARQNEEAAETHWIDPLCIDQMMCPSDMADGRYLLACELRLCLAWIE